MRHDLETALPADFEGSAEFVVEQERMGMEVPWRPHDATGELWLEAVATVLDLLADGFHPAIGAVDFQCMPRGQEMPTRGREEMPASCLVSGFDGALFSPAWRDALWARFFMAAPR